MVGDKYIRTLPTYVQNVIETLLKDTGMSFLDIELGMSSRLCDLEDVINSREINMDYFTRIDTIANALCELTGEQVLDLFTQYHGYQLLDNGFYRHLIDEGILEDEEEEEEEYEKKGV